MKKYISTVMTVSFLLLGLPSIAKSAYQTQLSNTTAWLTSQQNTDGSWGSNDHERFVLTVEAVRALRAAGLRKVAYHKGLAWLENHSASNFDYKSRRALALSAHGNAVNGILTVLDNAQDTSINQRDGWGMGADYLQSPVDTALVLTGLDVVGTSSGSASVAVQPALDYLKTAQLSGAGWPVSLGINSDVFTTAWVVKALNTWKHQDATLTTVISNGLNTLTSTVDNNTPYHLQALAAQTALEAGNSAAAQSWLSDLSGNLQSNGSLGDNIYNTSWAIRAFATADGVDDANLQIAVNIPDAALRNAINAALGRNALDALNRQELSQLTTLTAINLGISDLTGLEWAENLTNLDLRNNHIDDTSAIDNLTLASLQLEGNPVFPSNTPVQIPMMPLWGVIMMIVGLVTGSYFKQKHNFFEPLKLFSMIFFLWAPLSGLQAAENVLLDTQIKVLRHTSKVLLRSRLEQKRERKEKSVEDREELNALYGIVSQLESQMKKYQYTADYTLKPLTTQVKGSIVNIQKNQSTTFHYQPDSQTFIQEQLESQVNPSAINRLSSLETEQQQIITKEKPLNIIFSKARKELARLKNKHHERQSANNIGVMASLKKGRGQLNRKVKSISLVMAKRTVNRPLLLEDLIEDVEIEIEEIESKSSQRLNKVRRLKHRLSLHIPGNLSTDKQPTLSSVSKHRASK